MTTLAIGLPFMQGIGLPELLIILVVVLLLFGPKRLPQLGKSLGKTMRAIREGVDGNSELPEGEDEGDEKPVATAAKKPEEAEK